MLWGHRNDPVNFHRCLQDFDRRLPDLLDALRPGDLLIITSDHGCDPTTPSTDHSREHAMLLAYVEGRNAAGPIHEGEFADVGATVNAWLQGKSPSRGIPGQPIVAPMRLDNPLLVRWEYASEERLNKRNAIFRALVQGESPEDAAFAAVEERSRGAPARRGCGPGDLSERFVRDLGLEVHAFDISRADGRAHAQPRSRRAARRHRGAPVRRRRVRLRVRRLGALPRAEARSGDRRVRARPATRRASRRHDHRRGNLSEVWDLFEDGERREPVSFNRVERGRVACDGISPTSSSATSTRRSCSPTRVDSARSSRRPSTGRISRRACRE